MDSASETDTGMPPPPQGGSGSGTISVVFHTVGRQLQTRTGCRYLHCVVVARARSPTLPGAAGAVLAMTFALTHQAKTRQAIAQDARTQPWYCVPSTFTMADAALLAGRCTWRDGNNRQGGWGQASGVGETGRTAVWQAERW